MSKLGIHIISWNNSQPVLDFHGRAHPVIAKVMEFNDINAAALKGSSPGTLVVGRVYVDSQPLDNPAQNASDFMYQILNARSKVGALVDVWEGYNEVGIGSVDDARRYSDFTVAWANLMHANGLRCAAYSFSTGNPDYAYWPYLAPGARACDYLALHEYDSPRMDTHVGDLCLRYRKVRSLLPADARRPILITECGLDDGMGHGWKTFASVDSYISQLGWYDSELMKDDYVVGGTIFTIDGRDWNNFDLLPVLSPLADYILAHPGGTPPPPPPSQAPSITALSLGPATVITGQTLNVSITVKNGSSANLPTMGPDPGFIYNEGEDFRTRGFTEVKGAFRVGVDYDGRTGIDHPYRWGLGATLAPGATVTISGAIRLKTIASKNYWAGLVQEQIAWLQDNQGRKLISVQAAPPVGTTPVITGVSFTPATLNTGATLNISITVVNNSSAPLATQGPNPGFIYDEGDTFYTRGFAEIPDSFRVGVDFDSRSGIDHPYRWGLGPPLLPGQSVTITGGIKMKTAQKRNYWAGLVRERVAWLQDKQGQALITVSTPVPPPPPPGGGQPAITAATLSPAYMLQGQNLTVTVTITNKSNVALQTQGPNPGFIYNEGDNFLTKNNPSTPGAWRFGLDFDGRTGIDHPYRWGFGGPLAPGQSITVSGIVRLNRRQVTNFWLGLVHEQIAWVQDRLAMTQITVDRA